jgi:hypothetical protein
LPASSCNINTTKFGKYALETAELFVNKNPRYYMPAAVHKVLMHGEAIIKWTVLPIGKMSEEAS